MNDQTTTNITNTECMRRAVHLIEAAMLMLGVNPDTFAMTKLERTEGTNDPGWYSFELEYNDHGNIVTGAVNTDYGQNEIKFSIW